jgi:BASS family bile acid:Na+ symporter
MMIRPIGRLFPWWVLLPGLAAFYVPEPFVALQPAIVPLLGVVMFGMGMTLTPENFALVLRRPCTVALGVLLQFSLMPAAAWAIARSTGMATSLAAGMVLVGSCPGGTASNVICYLGRGDVALSITLTAVSTVLAVLLTPALTWWYVGQEVPVPAADMLVTIALVVLLPVAAGVVLNLMLKRRLVPLKRWFPVISVAVIALIVAVIVAMNRSELAILAPAVAGSVVLHNAAGLVAGYLVPRALGLDPRVCRTLAIEVGMQNSGLAVALATKYFSAAAALPGAVFSVWHNLSGAALAGYWSRRSEEGA